MECRTQVIFPGRKQCREPRSTQQNSLAFMFVFASSCNHPISVDQIRQSKSGKFCRLKRSAHVWLWQEAGVGAGACPKGSFVPISASRHFGVRRSYLNMFWRGTEHREKRAYSVIFSLRNASL